MPKGYRRLYTPEKVNEIGKEFIKFRSDNLLNQNELAVVLGVNRCTISNIERGTNEVRATTYRKFLRLWGTYGMMEGRYAVSVCSKKEKERAS